MKRAARPQAGPTAAVDMFDLDDFLRNFERVRERTRRVAACIPAGSIEWTYKPGAFTLGDLVRHIAATENSRMDATRCSRFSIGCTKMR